MFQAANCQSFLREISLTSVARRFPYFACILFYHTLWVVLSVFVKVLWILFSNDGFNFTYSSGDAWIPHTFSIFHSPWSVSRQVICSSLSPVRHFPQLYFFQGTESTIAQYCDWRNAHGILDYLFLLFIYHACLHFLTYLSYPSLGQFSLLVWVSLPHFWHRISIKHPF